MSEKQKEREREAVSENREINQNSNIREKTYGENRDKN